MKKIQKGVKIILEKENKLGYDRDIFDIEIEFDDEVVKRIERTETTREFEKLIESEE